MRKSKQFLGMNVVSLEEGEQIGSVGGLVIDPASKNVAALIIEQKGWFREQKFVPFSKVHRIGEDVVTIDRGNRVEKGASLPQILKLFKERVNITGCRLVTESGTLLGVVEEYYVDLKTGDIVGLEFSGGMVNNLFRGGAFLDINYIRTLGTRIIICLDSAIDNIVKMDGGLQETFRFFRENTGQLLETTIQKTKGLGRNINQSIEKLKREKQGREEMDSTDIDHSNQQENRCSCTHTHESEETERAETDKTNFSPVEIPHPELNPEENPDTQTKQH
ncbi:MAG: PRC-barrel domain-containing protein [Bacillota bacterium]